MLDEQERWKVMLRDREADISRIEANMQVRDSIRINIVRSHKFKWWYVCGNVPRLFLWNITKSVGWIHVFAHNEIDIFEIRYPLAGRAYSLLNLYPSLNPCPWLLDKARIDQCTWIINVPPNNQFRLSISSNFDSLFSSSLIYILLQRNLAADSVEGIPFFQLQRWSLTMEFRWVTEGTITAVSSDRSLESRS